MHSKKEPKHTIQELQQWQALPLSIKVRMTKQRIRDWINYYGEDGVYVSFSGGKDSTVLLDLVRQEYPNVVAVFVDTGLEFPEIRQFVKLFDNVEWVKPKMTFRQVIEKYGYPFISKEVSVGWNRHILIKPTSERCRVVRDSESVGCGESDNRSKRKRQTGDAGQYRLPVGFTDSEPIRAERTWTQKGTSKERIVLDNNSEGYP